MSTLQIIILIGYGLFIISFLGTKYLVKKFGVGDVVDQIQKESFGADMWKYKVLQYTSILIGAVLSGYLFYTNPSLGKAGIIMFVYYVCVLPLMFFSYKRLTKN